MGKTLLLGKKLFLAAATLLAAALLVGCIGQAQIPGNGDLVVLDADPGFSTHQFVDQQTGKTVFEIDAVRQGIHYWDEVGAQIRLPEEVTAQESARALHFGLHRDGHSLFNPQANGTDWLGLDYASIYPDVGNTRQYEVAFAQVVAHELGHAMGLGHLQDGVKGVMAATTNWYEPRLSPADVADFRVVWPAD